METSDSEDCYESADDDFVPQTERKPQVSSERHRPPDVKTNNNSPSSDLVTDKTAETCTLDKNVNAVLNEAENNVKSHSVEEIQKTKKGVDKNVNLITETTEFSLGVNSPPSDPVNDVEENVVKEVQPNIVEDVSFVEEIGKLRLVNEPQDNNNVQKPTLVENNLEEDMWAADEGWGWKDEDVSTMKAEETPGEKVEVRAEKKVEERVGKKVEERVGEKVEERVEKKLEERVEKKMEEKMEDDLWGDEEDWPAEESPQKKADAAWSGWGNWGITSVLSTVSQGITNVLDAGIGAPNPEDLARQHKLERDETNSTADDAQLLTFNLGDIVKLVETTGNKVISGGLDTLEVIGKKTMEVLQENDPGLKKKRAFLKIEPEKPVLSHLLREAKERAEAENVERERRNCRKKANYETIFDDRQGLVHLEALEMLSRQCDIKLQTLMNKCADGELVDLQETMAQVRELCELPPDDDEEDEQDDDIRAKIQSAVADINIPITYAKLLDLWDETGKWIEATEETNEMEVHRRAIETLAELTAVSVEQFHKAGELLLIKEHRSTADEADSLVQLTTSLSTIISTTSTAFGNKLSSLIDLKGNKEEINELITNVYLEAANSSTYIRDAFQLLIPVLQVGAV